MMNRPKNLKILNNIQDLGNGFDFQNSPENIDTHKKSSIAQKNPSDALNDATAPTKPVFNFNGIISFKEIKF